MRRKPRRLMSTLSAPRPPPQPSPKTPDASPRALYVLLLVVFINLVGFGMIIPLLPFYAKSLNAGAWQVTALFSAYSLGQFIAEPFWGRLSDRIGRRPVLIVTILANTLCYVALAFAPTSAGPSRSAWSAAAPPATSRRSRATWPTSPRPRSARAAWACWARRSAWASWSVPPWAACCRAWPSSSAIPTPGAWPSRSRC
jgi:MFS family permease